MTEEFSVDALEEAVGPANSNSMQVAAQLVESMAALQHDIDTLEANVKEKKAEFSVYTSKTVPEAMINANQLAFTLATGPFTGVACEIKDFVAGSIPKDDPDAPEGTPSVREAAFEHLIECGGGDLIKTFVTIEFPKSQVEYAHRLFRIARAILMIDEHVEATAITIEKSVHAQTLAAWAREKLISGEAFDPDKLGLFVGRVAKLKFPKDADAPKKPRKPRKTK